MEKNKKLIQKIKKVWKLQEELLIENHKEISKIIKDFSYKELKEILQEEEIELSLSQEDFENITSEVDKDDN
jgi:uncharacterized protein YajQ (UPF0234 family)